MKKVFIVMGLVMLTAAACKKNQPAPASQDQAEPAVAAAAAPISKSTVTAEGDIRDIMLALRRVHFPFDTSTLTDEAKQALDEASEKLRIHTDIFLYVDGHTDERGTAEYNMSLGERRSQTVVNYLSNSGIDKSRLSIVSFGQEKPMNSGSDEVAYAKNRRVEFRLMKGDIQFVLEEGVPVTDDGKPIAVN